MYRGIGQRGLSFLLAAALLLSPAALAAEGIQDTIEQNEPSQEQTLPADEQEIVLPVEEEEPEETLPVEPAEEPADDPEEDGEEPTDGEPPVEDLPEEPLLTEEPIIEPAAFSELNGLYIYANFPSDIGGGNGFTYRPETPAAWRVSKTTIVYGQTSVEIQKIHYQDFVGPSYYGTGEQIVREEPWFMDPTAEEMYLPRLRLPNYDFLGYYVYYGFDPAELWEQGVFDEKKLLTLMQSLDLSSDEVLSSSLPITAEYYTYDAEYQDYTISDAQVSALKQAVETQAGNGNFTADVNGCLPVFARWGKSSNATATALTLEQVNQSLEETKTTVYQHQDSYYLASPEQLEAVEATKTAFSPNHTEYYARVDLRTERINLDLTIFEPDSVVEVTSSYQGARVDHEYVRTLTYRPDTPPVGWEGEAGALVPSNGVQVENPYISTGIYVPESVNEARAQYRITDIPVYPSAGAGNYDNTITIRVVSPGGVAKSYTIHVQRLSDPALSLQPGNTPAGMILRDTHSKWADNHSQGSAAANKAKGIEYFFGTADRRFYRAAVDGSGFTYSANRPGDAANNEGGLYSGKYYAAAQVPSAVVGQTETMDLDASSKAIVVYMDQAFTDPGLLVRDALGNTVAPGSAVSRSLTLEKAVGNQFTWSSLLGTDAATTTYQIPSEAVNSVNGQDLIDLSGLGIVPGIYSMEYSYADPYLDEIYHSASSFYQDSTKEKADSYRRPVIVLPIPGDVDMDGAVTMLDGVALRTLLAEKSAGRFTMDADLWQLFSLRVCDANGDGTVDGSDVAALMSGYQPTIIRARETKYFYLPLPGASEPAQKELTYAADKGALSLRFLGISEETLEDIPAAPAGEGVEASVGDTVWMGIYLENAALANISGVVQSFEIRIAYDIDWMRPGFYPSTSSTDYTQWQAALKAANQDFSATFGSGYDYTLSTPRITMVQSADRAAYPTDCTGDYVELSIVVELGAGQQGSALKNGALLRIPFYLTGHPAGEENLVLPVVSMRGLSLKIDGGLRYAANYQGGSIFGLETRNLSDLIAYSRVDDIPIGDDKTPAQNIINQYTGSHGVIEYGEMFAYNLDATSGLQIDAGRSTLPVGIEVLNDGSISGYSGTWLYGIPEESGEFDFWFSGKHFKFTVDKAQLRVGIGSSRRIYGENNPDLTSLFYFNPQDIKASVDYDLFDAQMPDGTWEEFAKLGLSADGSTVHSSYAEPKLYVTTVANLLKNDKALYEIDMYTSVATACRTKVYGIQLPNYEIIYERVTQSSGTITSDSFGENGFTIDQRPIRIAEFDLSQPVGYVYHDVGVSTGQMLDVTLRATGMGANNPFTAELPVDENFVSWDRGAILPNDAVAIIFDVTLTTEKDDQDDKMLFAFSGTEADRTVAGLLTMEGSRWKVRLDEESAKNYRLYNVDMVKNRALTATVRPRTIKDFDITLSPSFTGYRTHGDILSLSDVTFRFTFEPDPAVDGAAETVYWTYDRVEEDGSRIPYGFSVYAYGEDNGVWAGWSRRVQNEDGTDKLDENGDFIYEYLEEFDPYYTYILLERHIHTAKYGPLYLTVSTTTFERDENGTATPVVIRRVLEEHPFDLAKRVIQLQVQPGNRYYGEPDPTPTITFFPQIIYEGSTGTTGTHGLAAHDLQAWNDMNEQVATIELLATLLTQQGDTLKAPQAVTSIQPPSFYVTPPSTVDHVHRLLQGSDFGAYHILLFGAESTNYDFEYARIANNNRVFHSRFGYNDFTVHRRPIYVSNMQATPHFVYDITFNESEYTRLNQVAKFGGQVQGSTAAELAPAAKDFTPAVPFQSGGTFYKYDINSATPPMAQKLYPLTGEAVYYKETTSGGKTTRVYDDVELLYTAIYQGKNTGTHSFNGYYYNLTDEDQWVNVYVGDIRLSENTGTKNKNYELIYDSYTNATYRYPNNRLMSEAGQVRLRQIYDLHITRLPTKMTGYAYGDPLILTGLQFSVFYENCNPAAGCGEVCTCPALEVPIDMTSVTTLLPFTNDIRIVWADTDELPSNQRDSIVGTDVTPADDGRYFSILAKRYLDRTTVNNTAELVEESATSPIRVTRLPMEITVKAQRRFYGEDINEYTITLNLRYLSGADRQALIDAGHIGSTTMSVDLTVNSLDTLISSPILDVLNGGTPAGWKLNAYDKNGEVVPITSKTDINLEGYELAMKQAENLTNYDITVQPSTLKIYRRPIWVTDVTGRDLATIYVTSSNGVTRDVTVYAIGGDAVNSQFESALTTNQYQPVEADGSVGNTLPLTTGRGAIIAGDRVNLDLTMTFHYANAGGVTDSEKWGISGDSTGAYVNCSFSGLALSTITQDTDNDNYIFISGSNPPNNSYSGYVDRRTISSIAFFQPAQINTNYIYGGSGLNLAGIVIEVTYNDGKKNYLPASNTDYFTVNFWDPSMSYPKTVAELEGWEDVILTQYASRLATNGQRLTVAPHGTMTFGHNDQYLLISAREHPGQEYTALPIRLPSTLRVSPKELDALAVVSPEMKYFDGTVGAGGYVQLNGIYQGEDGDGIDLVYVTTNSSRTFAGLSNANLKARLEEFISDGAAYRFSTSVDYSNTGAGMRLQFPLAGGGNVAYAGANDVSGQSFTEVVNQQVTAVNITLAGPDAANYRIASSLTQSGAQVPIQPAARTAANLQLLQKTAIRLQTDIRTNAITVTTPGTVAQETFRSVVDSKNDQQLRFLYFIQYYDEDLSKFCYLYYDKDLGEFVSTDNAAVGRDAGQYHNGVFGNQWITGDEFDPADSRAVLSGELPRDTYYRAGIALCQTENYQGTNIAWSVSDETFADAVASLKSEIAAEIAPFESLEAPKGEETPVPINRPAVSVAKTYPLRIDMLSVEWDEGAEEDLLRLEARVFTEMLKYEKAVQFDAIIENVVTTRYTSIYWDAAKKTTLAVERPEFEVPHDTMEFLDLTGSEAIYKLIEVRLNKNEYEPGVLWVNENQNLTVYTDYVAPSGGSPKPIGIVIDQGNMTMRLGDASVQLTVTCKPSYVTPVVVWTSSDPEVVTVDENGVLTFVGVGEATITATEQFGKTASITVTVLRPVARPIDGTLFRADGVQTIYLDQYNRFYPDSILTRGDAAIMLAGFFAANDVVTPAEPVDFADISPADRWYESVNLLSAWGIIEGIDGGLFAGDRQISRAEFVVMLHRMLVLNLMKGQQVYFVDVTSRSTWASDYINNLAELNYVEGTGDGYFYPARLLTKAEAVTFLTRIMRDGGYHLELNNAVMPIDVSKEHWAYDYIMFALYAVPPAGDDEE